MPQVVRRSQPIRIFISHSTVDKPFVERLAKDLCHVLNDENAVWFDKKTEAGKAWWDRISEELVSRKFFLLILSPEALRSNYVIDEIHMAWRRKNLKNKAKKDFIPIHLRDCMDKIPPKLDYLRDLQWIQLLPPVTYKSAFRTIIDRLGFPLDTNILEFLRKLEFIDQEFMHPTLPKAREDFKEEDIDKELASLGNTNAYYISQGSWDDVVNCAEQALVLAPDDPNWLRIKEEALNNLYQRELANINKFYADFNLTSDYEEEIIREPKAEKNPKRLWRARNFCLVKPNKHNKNCLRLLVLPLSHEREIQKIRAAPKRAPREVFLQMQSLMICNPLIEIYLVIKLVK